MSSDHNQVNSQDWSSVTWSKSNSSKKKINGFNKNKVVQNEVAQRLNKLDNAGGNNDEQSLKAKPISKSFGLLLQRERLNKKMSQKILAQKINVRPSLIMEYENSKGIPNQLIINKLNKVLGCTLKK
jgi:ribosome-binding protein aMBF1 (putative translation factor)